MRTPTARPQNATLSVDAFASVLQPMLIQAFDASVVALSGRRGPRLAAFTGSPYLLGAMTLRLPGLTQMVFSDTAFYGDGKGPLGKPPYRWPSKMVAAVSRWMQKRSQPDAPQPEGTFDHFVTMIAVHEVMHSAYGGFTRKERAHLLDVVLAEIGQGVRSIDVDACEPQNLRGRMGRMFGRSDAQRRAHVVASVERDIPYLSTAGILNKFEELVVHYAVRGLEPDPPDTAKAVLRAFIECAQRSGPLRGHTSEFDTRLRQTALDALRSLMADEGTRETYALSQAFAAVRRGESAERVEYWLDAADQIAGCVEAGDRDGPFTIEMQAITSMPAGDVAIRSRTYGVRRRRHAAADGVGADDADHRRGVGRHRELRDYPVSSSTRAQVATIGVLAAGAYGAVHAAAAVSGALVIGAKVASGDAFCSYFGEGVG